MLEKKKQSLKESTSDLFRWCVENDFQVYLVPLNDGGKGACKIGVRRRGITTNGLDVLKKQDGVVIKSKETLTEKTFRTHADAYKSMPLVYKQLKERYG